MTIEQVDSPQALVAARESKGLSPDDIQRQLKLHPRQVAAIETGDWASLPGLPFVRGTVRNYGRIVGVDVEPLLASISGTTRAPELRSSSSLAEPLRPAGMMGFGNGGSGSRWTWGLVIVAAAIALVLFFGRDNDLSKIPSLFSRSDSSGDNSSSSSKPGSETSRVDTVTIPPLATSAGTSAAPGSAAISPAPAAAVAPVPIPQPMVPATLPPAPEPAAAAPATPAEAQSLKLAFKADAWVEIKQRSDNKILLQGTQKADTNLDFPVPGPVAVTIGNAEKVKGEFAGKQLTLTVQPGKGIARLNLP